MTPFGQTLVRTTTTPHHTECGPATTAHNARLRNPATGESIAIPASTAPSFKAGKALRDTVNESNT